MSDPQPENFTAPQALALLAGAVRRYLDGPGCNEPARRTAFARLRWAVDQAAPSTAEEIGELTVGNCPHCGEPLP